MSADLAPDMICRVCLGDVWRTDVRWWHRNTGADYVPHPPHPVRRSIPLTERPKVVIW